MSLNFNFNNFKCAEKGVEFNFDDIVRQYRGNYVEKSILKFFDNQFLGYIVNRKQRDLILINYFYQLLLDASKISKKNIKDMELSTFFDVKNEKLVISEDVLSIFNMDEIVNELNNKISLLKTMEMFFNNNEENFKTQLPNIEMKIKKITNLNDDNILNRLTTNKELKRKILDNFIEVKKYEDVEINVGFYNSLKQMIESKKDLCK